MKARNCSSAFYSLLVSFVLIGLSQPLLAQDYEEEVVEEEVYEEEVVEEVYEEEVVEEEVYEEVVEEEVYEEEVVEEEVYEEVVEEVAGFEETEGPREVVGCVAYAIVDNEADILKYHVYNECGGGVKVTVEVRSTEVHCDATEVIHLAGDEDGYVEFACPEGTHYRPNVFYQE